MNTWPMLSEPIYPADNARIAQVMSAQTRNGCVPEFEVARRYAAEQGPVEPITDYAERRGY